jgi:hypothetical protein
MVALLAMGAALPAAAVMPDVPQGGLPSAVDYGATLLPERSGVVSWRTLAQVMPVKQGDHMVPEFSKDILALIQDVKVRASSFRSDMATRQKRFLLCRHRIARSAWPSRRDRRGDREDAGKYSPEPIVVSGRFALVKDDAGGVLYRLTDAEFSGAAMPSPSLPAR